MLHKDNTADMAIIVHDKIGNIYAKKKKIYLKETLSPPPQLVERAYSDSQQRRLNNNNGPTPQPASPLAQRRNNVGLGSGMGSGVGSGALFGTPTRV